MRSFKLNPLRGSHLPILSRLITLTEGPVLELGCGHYSTPFLHWACFPDRPLVTMESDKSWYDFLREFEKPWHQIVWVEDWDKVTLSEKWSIAFVDHSPSERRWKEVEKLTHAEYVVAHDAENNSNWKYKYFKAYTKFQYRWKYMADGRSPFTAVYSNYHHDIVEKLQAAGLKI